MVEMNGDKCTAIDCSLSGAGARRSNWSRFETDLFMIKTADLITKPEGQDTSCLGPPVLSCHHIRTLTAKPPLKKQVFV